MGVVLLGGFTRAIWHPQLKPNRVLNGRDTKWLQQSSCRKMATDGRRDTESKVSASLRPSLTLQLFQSLREVQGGCSSRADLTLCMRRADRSCLLLAEVVYNDCSTDPCLLENSGAWGVCERSVCVCVCVSEGDIDWSYFCFAT